MPAIAREVRYYLQTQQSPGPAPQAHVALGDHSAWGPVTRPPQGIAIADATRFTRRLPALLSTSREGAHLERAAEARRQDPGENGLDAHGTTEVCRCRRRHECPNYFRKRPMATIWTGVDAGW